MCKVPVLQCLRAYASEPVRHRKERREKSCATETDLRSWYLQRIGNTKAIQQMTLEKRMETKQFPRYVYMQKMDESIRPNSPQNYNLLSRKTVDVNTDWKRQRRLSRIMRAVSLPYETASWLLVCVIYIHVGDSDANAESTLIIFINVTEREGGRECVEALPHLSVGESHVQA